MTDDVADGYVLAFGGYPDGGSTWTFANGTWTNRTSSLAVSPGPRSGAAMTYDATAHEVVLFGGFDPANHELNDTWTYRSGVWRNVTLSSGAAPPSNFTDGFALAYAPTEGLDVLLGGIGPRTETWLYYGGMWNYSPLRVNPPVPGGVALSDLPLATDYADAAVVMFDGTTRETWLFGGIAWQNVTATAGTPPSARVGASMGSDPVGGVLLFGGVPANGSGREFDDTWRFFEGVWSQVGLNGTAAPARVGAALARYPGEQAVLMYGGYDLYNETMYTETWSFDGGNWSLISGPQTPDPTAGASLAFDSTSGAVILFGGLGRNDTWSYTGGTWTQLVTPVAPPDRVEASLANDPSDGGLVLFGGLGELSSGLASVILGDTWIWARGTWTNITATSGGPSPRFGASISYSSASNQVVLFGGENATSLFNDTWTFDNGLWTLVSTGGIAPPARAGAALGEDSNTGVLLLFGGDWCGKNISSSCANTWTYVDGRWTEAFPATIPPSRAYAGIVWDPSLDGYILVGGRESGASSSLLSDTWLYSGSEWTDLTGAVGALPVGGVGGALTIDPASGFPFLFGSPTLIGSLVETAEWWELITTESYPITFTESGLAAGTTWSVSLSGANLSSTSSSISAVRPNGTYAFSILPVDGLPATPPSGTIDVAGLPVTESVSFAAPTYRVTFAEEGLPVGTNWSVSVNGTDEYSTSPSVLFKLVDGTYSFKVATDAQYIFTPMEGSFNVSGVPLAETIVFRAIYSVTFRETGLPDGTAWAVTLNGTPFGSRTGLVVFSEPNGSYHYAISIPSGYSSNVTSGKVIVNGGPLNVSVGCSADHAMTTPIVVGPSWVLYALIGGAVTAVVASVVFLLVRSRHRARGLSSVAGPPKR